MSWAFTELEVIRWSEARGIIPNSTSLAQLSKAYEEMEELENALNLRDKPGIIDGLGDVLVCLINVAALEDLDLTRCLEAAFSEIKHRKCHMNKEGIFIKNGSS